METSKVVEGPTLSEPVRFGARFLMCIAMLLAKRLATRGTTRIVVRRPAYAELYLDIPHDNRVGLQLHQLDEERSWKAMIGELWSLGGTVEFDMWHVNWAQRLSVRCEATSFDEINIAFEPMVHEVR